jgi:hypothetical protein
MKMESETAYIEKTDSCEISINQSGKWSGKVKVYSSSINKAMQKALNKGKELAVIIDEQNKRG